MIMNIKFKDIEILEFYPSRTWVTDIICSYSEFGNKTGDIFAKQLGSDIQKYLAYVGKGEFVQNKTAYKIRHKPTNTILYVGCFDYDYNIGLSIKQEKNQKKFYLINVDVNL